MSLNVNESKKKVNGILSSIQNILSYDPQIIFTDTFERIFQQLKAFEDIFNSINSIESNYWIAYNMLLTIFPIIEKLVFCGYSDQILEFLLQINYTVSSTLIFRTSRFIPFRMQIFSLVCFAMSNTTQRREKDAENYISSFKSELNQLKHLEESNINGLSVNVKTCNGDTINLKNLFSLCSTTISKMTVHFSSSEEIEFEKAGQPKPKQRSKKVVKEDVQAQVQPLPSQKAVEMVINAFDSPLSKADYLTKYSQIAQAWTNPECSLDISLLHRLLFSFIRSGSFNETEQLLASKPDDPIIKLASFIGQSKWIDASKLLASLTKETIEKDYQFFNEVALKIWNEYSAKRIQDPLVLTGVLHVLILLPSPCPMHVALTALHLCIHLESLKRYEECIAAASEALDVISNFRDIFATRKIDKLIPPTQAIPTKPVDKSFILFEHWLECLHVDLLTVWISSQLKNGLINDTEDAKKKFEEDIEAKKVECEKTKKLYGILSADQRAYFDEEISKQFKPPQHSATAEEKLLNEFKSNYAVKALIYIQMSFFRPSKAIQFLEQARESLLELESLNQQPNSPVVYANTHEVVFTAADVLPLAKTIVLYGKEVIGNVGLTTSNTHLTGCGIKQDKTEPFIITNLKPNTLYTFAFGGYNSQNELIDNLTQSFTVTTCHTHCTELIWSYIASAAYKSRDLTSFDASLTYLLQRYTTINEVSEENEFSKHMNPFNRFLLKNEIISEPAPLIRSFASTLLMAARLFSSKPLHATSFQHLSLALAQILNNSDLVLTACRETLATIQPLISKTYHTPWVIQPLLSVVNALKYNKKTANEPEHQMILAKASYALDSSFVTLYQERQISLFIMSTVMELPANSWKTAFMLFAAKNHLAETTFGNDQTLPIYAAEMFRTAPEKSFDELFTKFKADPLFYQAAVYLISAAHNTGMVVQGSNWAKQLNDYIKSLLHEQEEKQTTKKSVKNVKVTPKKKQTSLKGKQKEQAKNNQEDAQMTQAAHKIFQVWTKYQARQKNIKKFYENNKTRCVVSLLNAMCMLENNQILAHSNPAPADVQKKDPKHVKPGRPPKHVPKKTNEEEKEVGFDLANQYIQSTINAIVLAERCDKNEIIHCATVLFRTFISTIKPKTPVFENLSQRLTSLAYVLVDYLPLNEKWARDTLSDILLLVLHNGKPEIVLDVLSKAVKVDVKCGMMLWMTHGKDLPEDLQDVLSIIQKRDPTENSFYAASDILNRTDPSNVECFMKEGSSGEVSALVKAAGDIAISLQHKQRLSMSISLLRMIGFMYHEKHNDKLSLKKWCEALECHFRLVKAHEKVDQILKDQTEETFYKKHSWSGCISIFVLASFIAMHREKEQAMQLCKLAAFAISSLFSNTYTNPKKQVDYANFEPPEIVPGVDIFSEYDPAQPLLEPVKAPILSKAIIFLLSAMETYEIHFEMFKPLSFARHFFRFIAREKIVLARVRLAAALNCAKFGLITQAVNIVNDIVSNFGLPHFTKESTLVLPTNKKYEFIQSEPISSPVNSECLKFLTSPQTITTVSNSFGAQISCQFVLCICRLLSVISESQNPVVESIELMPSSTNKAAASLSKKVHRRSHLPHSKKDDPLPVGSLLSNSDAASDILKNSELIISEFIAKEYRADQLTIKLELQLELASIKMHQWMWESAIQICQEVIKGINEGCLEGIPFGDNHLDKSFNLTSGLIEIANRMISQCSYNVHDLKGAAKAPSPYTQALLLIHKADYEGAAKFLIKVALSRPLTAFYKEYTLCCAQLVTLFCANPQLYDTCLVDLSQKQKQEIAPITLANATYQKTEEFFIQQLGLKEERNLYLRDTHLLIRLQYLVAKANSCFNGEEDTLDILENAMNDMNVLCPYVAHGLSFIISATAARIRMQKFVTNNPNIIQFWNKEVNPLKAPTIPRFSPQEVNKMIESLNIMFANHPDCVVHPASNQTILDLAILTGIALDDENRLSKSLNVLTVASAVRTSKRFIQFLVSQCPDTPAPNCPVLLQNDNKDQSMRQLAAAYYAHVCSLDMPIFDTEILETRTMLFFRCFEEQCASFKSLTADPESLQEVNNITGQWYQIDCKNIKSDDKADGATTLRSGRSIQSSIYSGTSRATTASGQRKHSYLTGIIHFFIGIITANVESIDKKTTTVKLTPIVIAGNINEIQVIFNEMSEIGINVQEVAHMEKVSGMEEQKKDANESKNNRKKAQTKILKSTTNLQIPTVTAPLRSQAETAARNASLKWNVTTHKLEAFLTKSSKIISSLDKKSVRWGDDIKLTDVEKESAVTFSHIFNTRFGVRDKDENVCKWLLSLQEKALSEPTPLPQLK